jgi:hypothetical protein
MRRGLPGATTKPKVRGAILIVQTEAPGASFSTKGTLQAFDRWS